jgi:iron complex outermembrane receptor protein
MRESNTFVDFVPDDRVYIAPALKWQPSDATSLTLLSHYQKSRSKYVFGFAPEGTVLPNPNGPVPVNRYIGEPDRDRFDNEVYSVSYLFEHAFSDSLKLRNNASFFQSRTSMPATWPLGIDEDLRHISRFAETIREDKSSAGTIDLSLEYKWATGNIANTLLVGIDHTIQRHQSERWLNFPADLDIYDPVYNIPYTAEAFMRNYPASRKERYNLTGIYAQNQAKIADKWVVMLGGRMDWAKKGLSPITGPEVWADEHSRAFSGRAGVVYLADNGLAPFVSWSQSFQPQAGVDRVGDRLKPTTGNQYEIGLRYQPKNRDMLLSAVVYQLTRQNVVTPGDASGTFLVQTGEMRSRGVEIEARVQATQGLSLIGAYTYTDAKTTKSNIISDVGKRTGAVPRHQASLWNQLDLGLFGISGLKAGTGVRYVGSSTGTYVDVRVPAFTLVDSMVSYETGPWRLSANAYNLLNNIHVTNCIDVCYYGEPRRVIGTLSYRW